MLFLRFLATTVLITFFSIHVVDAAVQVTGATSGYDKDFESRPLRLEINEFKHSGASWDLYVQALKRFQDADYTDPLSYFQIAGIHGYPTRPWDVVAGSSEFPGGFCYHNSVLFPIWHRPYLALYEVRYAQPFRIELTVTASTHRTCQDYRQRVFESTARPIYCCSGEVASTVLGLGTS